MLYLLAFIFPIAWGTILFVKFGKQETWPKGPYMLGIILTDIFAIASMVAGKPITLFTLSPKVSFAFDMDVVGKWFLAAVLLLYTLTLVYAFVYLKIEEHVPTFLAFYFISLGALIAVCSSANLVTIYFAFELTTLTTVPLVLHEQSKEAVAAGLKYLFYSIGGALLGLLGVFFLYSYSQDPSAFVPGGVLDAAKASGNQTILLVAFFLAILGYGTKAGMYPMHGWLPTAHPIAPAPASALLSGIIAKSGVLVIIRFVFYSVGADFLRGTWVQYAWIGIALLTIFMGSMMAFGEKILKKRLAYSTISQISYVMLGMALLTQEGLQGGLLQMMQHAASKACLFLCAGAFIYLYKKRDVRELKGIGKTSPMILWAFFFAAMSLVGIPPMGGFTSKWHLAQAALNSGLGFLSVLAPIVLLVSALLTAGNLFPVVIDGFFPGHEEGEGHGHGDRDGKGGDNAHSDRDGKGGDHAHAAAGEQKKGPFEKAPAMMWLPLIGLCLISLVIGLFGNSLVAMFGGIV